SDCRKLLEDGWVADVARVDDVVAPSQKRLRFGPEQTVRIGDEAYAKHGPRVTLIWTTLGGEANVAARRSSAGVSATIEVARSCPPSFPPVEEIQPAASQGAVEARRFPTVPRGTRSSAQRSARESQAPAYPVRATRTPSPPTLRPGSPSYPYREGGSTRSPLRQLPSTAPSRCIGTSARTRSGPRARHAFEMPRRAPWLARAPRHPGSVASGSRRT